MRGGALIAGSRTRTATISEFVVQLKKRGSRIFHSTLVRGTAQDTLSSIRTRWGHDGYPALGSEGECLWALSICAAGTSGGSASMLRVGKQKRTAMKIVECVPIVLCGCTQESIPEATPALVPRTQIWMVVISEPPERLECEFRDNFRDFGGHPDQQRGKADVLPRGIPRNRQRISGQIHGNDPRKIPHHGVGKIETLPALRPSPPADVAELKIRKEERTSARSQADLVIHGEPKSPMCAHDRRRRRYTSTFCRAGQALEVPVIEVTNEIETRSANPTSSGQSASNVRVHAIPGPIRHVRSPEPPSQQFTPSGLRTNLEYLVILGTNSGLTGSARSASVP